MVLGSQAQVNLVKGDSQSNLKNKLDVLAGSLQNPFIHIRNWIKGEMFSLDSLIQAITEKECCDARKGQACKRLTDDREHLSKLNEGKFALKSMFKTSSGK